MLFIYFLLILEIFQVFGASTVEHSSDPSNVTNWTIIDNRTNYCDLHKKVELGEIPLEKALQGMKVRASTFIHPDSKPNIGVMMLDELAKRAGFEWRNSFGMPKKTGKNESYTAALLRYTHEYDIVLPYWVRSVERLSLGIVFTDGWYDADTVMIRKKVQDQEYFNLFAMFLPFTSGLWILIFVTALVTGIVHYFLEYLYCRSNKIEMEDEGFGGQIFLNIQMFMGQCNNNPKARASRILTGSTCFISLILIAAFTANLANFFIMKSSSEIIVNTIDDVLKNNLLTCSKRGIVMTENFKKKYPSARIDEYETYEELFEALSEGYCDVGLTLMEIYKEKSIDQTYNKYCDLEWVGRRVASSQASFAIADSEELCLSLLRNALDVHLYQMKEEGVVELIWESYFDSLPMSVCTAANEDEATDDGRLSVLNLAGAFVFHALLIFISVIYGLYESYHSQPDENKILIKKDIVSAWQSKRISTLRRSCQDSTTTKTSEISEITESSCLIQQSRDIKELKHQVRSLQESIDLIHRALINKDSPSP